MSDTLHESFITNDSTASNIYGANWVAQSFIADSNYTITSISALMYKVGSPGALYASIRAVDGNDYPTGSDLGDVTGTADGDSLQVSPTYTWLEFVFSSGIPLTAGTHYAIVIRNTNKTSSNRALWRCTATTDYYTTGVYSASSNSGVTWATVTNRDQLFKNYGIVVALNFDEGTLVVSGTGSVVLSTESVTFLYTEGVLIVSGTGVVILAAETLRVNKWPLDRPADYDEDLIWDEETGDWITGEIGPSRYKQQLIVIGQGNANQGEIYFG
jgi:hypothetical protein